MVVKTAQYFFQRVIVLIAIASFLSGLAAPSSAQTLVYQPPNPVSVIKGLRVDAGDPFRLDFFVTGGEQEDTQRLVRYFLASVAVPDQDLWVNLSPHEKDRIIAEGFGRTAMGRDLLQQDYQLKQLTASLLSPDTATGRAFWDNVYREAREKYGVTDIPLETLNRVWIVPGKAVVYEGHNVRRMTHDSPVAYIVEAKMKVMMESDYNEGRPSRLRPAEGQDAEGTRDEGRKRENEGTMDEKSSESDFKDDFSTERPSFSVSSSASIVPRPSSLVNRQSTIMREILIPAIERQVNEAPEFANLRQIYHSLVLATWYKRKMKAGLFARAYAGRNKVAGLEGLKSEVGGRKSSSDLRPQTSDYLTPEQIWQQYVETFRSGAFDVIREECDGPSCSELVPRRYFSGGFDAAQMNNVLQTVTGAGPLDVDPGTVSRVYLRPLIDRKDNAMKAPRLVETEYDLRKYVPEEYWDWPIEFVVAADNSGTLVANQLRPMSDGIRRPLESLLAKGGYLVVNSGDNLDAIEISHVQLLRFIGEHRLGKQYFAAWDGGSSIGASVRRRELTDAEKQIQQIGKKYQQDEDTRALMDKAIAKAFPELGGTDMGPQLRAIAEQVREYRVVVLQKVPDWPDETRHQISEKVLKAFYNQLLFRVEHNKEFEAQLIQLLRNRVPHFKGRVAAYLKEQELRSLEDIRVKAEAGQWGVRDGDKALPDDKRNIVTYILPDLIDEHPAAIYDSGSKVAIDCVHFFSKEPFHSTLGLQFFEDMLEEIEPEIKPLQRGEQKFLLFAGSNFLDVAAVSKASAVARLINTHLKPPAGKLRVYLKVGDGGNDLETMRATLGFWSGPEINLSVFVAHDVGFAGGLPAGALVSTKTRVEGAAEVLQWADDISGRTVREGLPVFKALKWEFPSEDTLGDLPAPVLLRAQALREVGDRLQKRMPGLHFKNAAILRQRELLFGSDERLDREDPRLDSRLGPRENRLAYWGNEFDFRSEFLQIFRDYMAGRWKTREAFAERLKRLHRVVHMGADGKTPFVPRTMLALKYPRESIEQLRQEVEETAGKFQEFVDSRDLDIVYEDFKAVIAHFMLMGPIDETALTMSLSVLYSDLLGGWNTTDDLFDYSNNLFALGIVNGFRRLAGFEGIPGDDLERIVLEGISDPPPGSEGHRPGAPPVFDTMLRQSQEVKEADGSVGESGKAVDQAQDVGGIDFNTDRVVLEGTTSGGFEGLGAGPLMRLEGVQPVILQQQSGLTPQAFLGID